MAIEVQHDLFRSNSLVGFRYGKKEADFLRELHAAYKAGVVKKK